MTPVGALPDFRHADNLGCKHVDPEVFFPVKATVKEIARAKRVCGRCPFVKECAAHALRNREKYGVWGSTTAAEREAVWKRPRRPRGRPPIPKGVAACRPLVDRGALFEVAGLVAAGELTTSRAMARLGVGATLVRSAVRVVVRTPHLVDAVVSGRMTLEAARVAAVHR